MPVVGNRIKVASSDTGAGNITLGSAEDGFQTFAEGGISNNDVVRYVITEGSAWEIGKGTYLTSGPTLTRTSGNLLESSTGSLLNLSGSATVFVSLADVDVMQTDGGTFSGAVTFSADTNLNGITAGNQAIYRGNGALKLTGGGPQNSRNLVNLSNNAGATIYGGSASTNATLRSTYGVTIDGGDGDVTLDSDVTFTGASYSALWDTSDSSLVFNDNAFAKFGTGGDFTIKHNGANAYITNATGHIYFYNSANDKDLIFQTDNGAGGLANYIVADGSSGEVTLYYYGSPKLVTSSSGIDVTGISKATSRLETYGSDDVKLKLQSSGTGFRHLTLGVDDTNSKTFINSTYSTTGSYPLSFQMAGTEKMLLSTAGALTLNGAYTFPTADGTNGQVLTTDGSGAVTFADVSASANDDIFWENGQTVSSNYTITNGKNAMSAGPITIASGVTVTVGAGEAWTVV